MGQVYPETFTVVHDTFIANAGHENTNFVDHEEVSVNKGSGNGQKWGLFYYNLEADCPFGLNGDFHFELLESASLIVHVTSADCKHNGCTLQLREYESFDASTITWNSADTDLSNFPIIDSVDVADNFFGSVSFDITDHAKSVHKYYLLTLKNSGTVTIQSNTSKVDIQNPDMPDDIPAESGIIHDTITVRGYQMEYLYLNTTHATSDYTCVLTFGVPWRASSGRNMMPILSSVCNVLSITLIGMGTLGDKWPTIPEAGVDSWFKHPRHRDFIHDFLVNIQPVIGWKNGKLISFVQDIAGLMHGDVYANTDLSDDYVMHFVADSWLADCNQTLQDGGLCWINTAFPNNPNTTQYKRSIESSPTGEQFFYIVDVWLGRNPNFPIIPFPQAYTRRTLSDELVESYVADYDPWVPDIEANQTRAVLLNFPRRACSPPLDNGTVVQTDEQIAFNGIIDYFLNTTKPVVVFYASPNGGAVVKHKGQLEFMSDNYFDVTHMCTTASPHGFMEDGPYTLAQAMVDQITNKLLS